MEKAIIYNDVRYSYFKMLPSHSPAEIAEDHERCQNSTWPGWDSYRLCPKYEPKALLLHDPASWLVSYYLFVLFQVSCAYLSQEERNVYDHTLTRKWNHRKKEHKPVSQHISPSSCQLIKEWIKFPLSGSSES
jgi:hypothetical protein